MDEACLSTAASKVLPSKTMMSSGMQSFFGGWAGVLSGVYEFRDPKKLLAWGGVNEFRDPKLFGVWDGLLGGARLGITASSLLLSR